VHNHIKFFAISRLLKKDCTGTTIYIPLFINKNEQKNKNRLSTKLEENTANTLEIKIHLTINGQYFYKM